MYGIRVPQREAHKLSDMLNQVFLNKEHCINTYPISDICRVMGVESAEIVMLYSTPVINVYM